MFRLIFAIHQNVTSMAYYSTTTRPTHHGVGSSDVRNHSHHFHAIQFCPDFIQQQERDSMWDRYVWLQFNLVWVLQLPQTFEHHRLTISDVFPHLNCVHLDKSHGLNGWKPQQWFSQFDHHIDVLFSCLVSKLQFFLHQGAACPDHTGASWAAAVSHACL